MESILPENNSFKKSFSLFHVQITRDVIIIDLLLSMTCTNHIVPQQYSSYTSKNNAEGINETIIFIIM